jgi:hypothetical protein
LESEAPENTALEGLLATITDRKIRRKIQKLLQLGEEAVRALGELDVALYLRDDGEEQLQIVADAVLSHFRRLLEYVVMVAPPPAPPSDNGVVELDLEGGGSAPNKSGPMSARSMVPHNKRSDDDKWNALSKEMSTFQYGLGFELKEFERRFAHALAQDNKEQAVRDLNDATTGLTDGVFAVMTTVYECFLGYAEPERMVPGHRDTAIQSRETPKDVAVASYQRLVEIVDTFINSDVFYYLRSDTRRDFAQFYEVFAAGNASRNRLDCEGFDKYLDSLAVVNQRGVLIKHDTDLKAKIAGDLERALKFAAVVPDVAVEVIQQSFVMAERLSGLTDQIDELNYQWSSLTEEQTFDLDFTVALGRQLVDLVRPPRAMSSSEDGDVF